MRPRIATDSLGLVFLLALVTAGVSPAAGRVELDRGLRAIEAGTPVPVANRPLDNGGRLAARLYGRAYSIPPRDYVPPAEFGVLLEYDGTRAELEASGLRIGTQAGRIFTARVRPDEIGRLRGVAGLRNVRLARYCETHLNQSLPDTRADLEHAASGSPPVYAGHAGNGTLIGDVDTGVDFTRSDFNDDLGKTRIQYIWDQTDAAGPTPSGFAYGSEWTKSDIDNSPAGVRERDTNGHGTLVAGVLVGNGSMTGCSQPAYRFTGVAPLAKFIAVKTDLSDAGIIDGVNYVFQKAAAMGLNAVVNLSVGSAFGPHDGSGLFSTAVSSLTGPGRVVVASAGNNQGVPLHGRLTTTSTTVGVDKFTFTIPAYTAASGTFNDYIVISGWYEPTASYTIRVKGPNAADTLSVGFGQLADRNLAIASSKGGKLFVANQTSTLGFGGTAKGRQFEVEVYDSVATNAPRNGTWEVDVVSNGAANIGKRVDLWVYGSNFGATGLGASVVTGLDNTTMVGEPADGDSVIAVAAHATKASWTSCASGGCGYGTPPTLGAIASFSCVGPRRDGVLKPEISAPGFGVATTHSSHAAAMGTCADADDGVHEITQGTSFSSPHVAGAAALFLEYMPNSSPSKVKQAFEAHARSDASTGATPNNTWGYGKLDIYATIDHVAPTCSVTSPAGGESWTANGSQTISWAASDNIGVTTVDLALSTDGGATYPTAIATGIANTGSYTWTVPAVNSATARVRVTAHDAGNNVAVAGSAANFTITQSLSVPPPQPLEFAVTSRPNPMRGTAVIEMSVPRQSMVRLSLIDLQGRELRRFAAGPVSAGRYTYGWDGRAGGHRAAAGLYFLLYETPDRTLIQRIVMTR
jgi:minor extracellular serine protease Vpr